MRKNNVYFGKVFMGAKEFYIDAGDKKIEAFIMDSFLDARIGLSPLHSHRYTEIHFTARGECVISADEKAIVTKEGMITAIPRGVLHRLSSFAEGTFHMAFCINYPLDGVMQSKVAPGFLSDLAKLIKTYDEHKNFDLIANYLAFIVKDVVRAHTDLRLVTNREFLINEFFTNHYNEDISIGDIAAELNVSVKQASRLVEKYMGASFSRVLSEYRLSAAKKLLSGDEKRSLSEVAELVGYRSYSGFWKAFKKYGMRYE